MQSRLLYISSFLRTEPNGKPATSVQKAKTVLPTVGLAHEIKLEFAQRGPYFQEELR